MQISPGSIVRPIISAAGLDARQQYIVRHVVSTPFASITYLEDRTGALLPPVANAHTLLEPVKPAAPSLPTVALFN